jgi:hypothetical protein
LGLFGFRKIAQASTLVLKIYICVNQKGTSEGRLRQQEDLANKTHKDENEKQAESLLFFKLLPFNISHYC